MSIFSPEKNIYPSVISGPTVYQTPTIYNIGASGPVVIPDDVNIYEKLYAVSNISDSQKIGINFNGNTKDVMLFVICTCKLPALSNRIEIFKFKGNTGPYLTFSWNYANNTGFAWFNGGNSANTYISPDLHYNNSRMCIAIENNKLKDLFAQSTLDTQNSCYAPKSYNGLTVPNGNISISNGYEFAVYKIGIKDKDGNYLFEFLPAKKSGVAGFYDVINGTFSKASDATAWDCDGEVII